MATRGARPSTMTGRSTPISTRSASTMASSSPALSSAFTEYVLFGLFNYFVLVRGSQFCTGCTVYRGRMDAQEERMALHYDLPVYQDAYPWILGVFEHNNPVRAIRFEAVNARSTIWNGGYCV